MNETEIRKRRQRLGMTQRAFAAAIGVHVATLSRWERGEVKLKLKSQLDKLDKVFNGQLPPSERVANEKTAPKRARTSEKGRAPRTKKPAEPASKSAVSVTRRNLAMSTTFGKNEVTIRASRQVLSQLSREERQALIRVIRLGLEPLGYEMQSWKNLAERR